MTTLPNQVVRPVLLSAPDVTKAEEDALVRAVRSGWIAPLGPEVDAFEAELAQYTGRRHAVALSSGTAALHLGLLTLGIGPGDLVLTSTMTFAATANAIKYTGAEPVFIDCVDDGNINPELLSHALQRLASHRSRVRAIVPVDLFGKVAQHEHICPIAEDHNLEILSDAAESLGAVRHGTPSAAFGVAAAVSFNGNKIMTTSGGGALMTDNPEIADKVRYLASQARQPYHYYEHTEVGYNYRLSNLLAALGRAQLGRLDEMIARRFHLRTTYKALFSGVDGVTVLGEPSGLPGGETRDNFWLTSILINPEVSGFDAESLRRFLAQHDIEARRLWKPMHMQPVYANNQQFTDGTSERLFRRGLSLPSASVLDEQAISHTIGTLETFLAEHARR